jgi:cytochrome c oxidase subunit 5a
LVKPATKLTPTRQRNLNNAFAYDLVPAPTVIAAALKAARRVNDFPTAVRVFEGKD